jgi:hypothetical protein
MKVSIIGAAGIVGVLVPPLALLSRVWLTSL